MTNGVNETEKSLKRLRRETPPQTDERILADATAEFERAVKLRVSGRWQIVLAAVAVLAIVVLAVVLTLPGGKQPISKAIQQIRQSEPAAETQAQQQAPRRQPRQVVEELMTGNETPPQADEVQDKFLRVAEYAEAEEPNEPNIPHIAETVDDNDVNKTTAYSQPEEAGTEVAPGCALFGYVFDVNNEPLSSAEIEVDTGREQFSGGTDSEGWYEIEGLPGEVQSAVTIFAEGFGYNSFDYTCMEPNVRLDVQIYPPGYDWYNTEPPPLYVERWLNFEPGSLKELRGKIVVLVFGEKLEEKGDFLKELNDFTNEYDSNELEVIAVRSRVNFDEQKEAEIQQVLEELDIYFAFGIDAAPEVSGVRILPESVEFGKGQVTIIRKGKTEAGAVHSLYDVRTNGALYIIDKEGIMVGCFGIEDLRRQIESLSVRR